MVRTDTIGGRPVFYIQMGDKYVVFLGERTHLDYLDYHPPYVEYERPATDGDLNRMREEIERTRQLLELVRSGNFEGFY